jgi:hypothetical protein
MIATYVVHGIDESLMGGRFVEKVPPALVARIFLD